MELSYERVQRVSKILFLPRENKAHIFKPLCNVLLGMMNGPLKF